MTSVEIQGNKRTVLGKKGSKLDRAAGNIPAVLYGGNEVIHFSVKPSNVKSMIYTADFKIANLEIDGKKYKAILKSLQQNPITDEVTHIDFLRIIEGTPIKVDLPVRFKGASPGVKVGGKLIQQLRKVKVKTLPEYLVDELNADISKLELGQSLRIKDIMLPEGVMVMSNPATPIALIEIPRALKAAAAAAAKEVKGGKKK